MRRGRPRHPELLTPREQEVLSLIREGLTNDQIASRLGISEPGARYHVSEILSKLGVSTRVEAAQWQGDERSPVPVVVPLLTRLGNAFGQVGSRPWAIASVVIATLAFIALAIGVVMNELRSGEDPDEAIVPSPTPSLELDQLHALVEEAEQIVAVLTPDAFLYRIVYGRGGSDPLPGEPPDRETEYYHLYYTSPSSGTTTFLERFSIPEQGWRTSTTPINDAVSDPLDLSRLVHSLRAVSAHAVTQGASPPVRDCRGVCQTITLEDDGSGPVWTLSGDGTNDNDETQVDCTLPDSAPLSGMSCSPPVTPTPRPASSPRLPVSPAPGLDADGVRELEQVALRLARIFEPDADLVWFSGGGTVGSEVSYRFGFMSDGQTFIEIGRQSATSWSVGLPGPSPFDRPYPLLDLTNLEHGISEIVAATQEQAFVANVGVSLLLEGGVLVWHATGIRNGSGVRCTLPDDAPISELECEGDDLPPTRSPQAR